MTPVIKPNQFRFSTPVDVDGKQMYVYRVHRMVAGVRVKLYREYVNPFLRLVVKTEEL